MKNTSNKPGGLLLGNAFILVAAIFWGINVTVTKALIPEWMTADGVSAVRLVGGCILMWIASLFVKCSPIARTDWARLILGGAVGLFMFIYLFVTSLRFANAIDVSIIMTLPPVFVLLMQVVFLKSRPAWLEYAGVAVSMAGAAVVILAGNSGGSHAGPDNTLGLLLAVASTICYAFYLVILEGPSKTYRPVNMLRWVFLFAAIPACLILPHFDSQHLFAATTAGPWVEISFILLCPTFIAYFLVQPAEKLIGSEMVSLYQYLIPVFAAISAVVMKLEALHWIQIVAMVIVVIGMVLTNLGKRRRTSAISSSSASSSPS